jgi:hypothetical protein
MVIGAGPVGRVQAQRLAQHELSKPVYHHTSLLSRALNAVSGFLDRIFSDASQATPGGWWTLVALIAVIVAVIAVIVVRLGPVAGSGRRRTSALRDPDGRPRTARRLREESATAAAEGDYATAILQRLRAIATGCEERRVLVPDAGRTADEFAALAGARFPAHAAGLRVAVAEFDHVRYGGGSGTLDAYERLRTLDETLDRLSPATVGTLASATASTAVTP